jgi:guanylate kinase
MFSNGLLIVISAPSGTGKGTILNLLREKNERVRFSVSATTRNPRKGEIEGKSYFFKTKEEFNQLIENNQLIEWVEYCNNLYGTPRAYVEDSLEEGYDVILEIEVEGAANIKRQYPDCVSIFILPPSFDELDSRISGRGTESRDIIEKRLEKAKREVSNFSEYDYVVINDDINVAADKILSIIMAEKLTVKRNKDILLKLGMLNEEW